LLLSAVLRRRCCWGAPAAVNRYLLPARRSAANPPQVAAAAVDRFKRQDGCEWVSVSFGTGLYPGKKGKGSPYWITERMVLELIPVLGSQPAGDVSHKPGGTLPLLSARPAVTPATLKRAATSFAAW